MGARNSAIADNTAYLETNLKEIEFAIDENEIDFIKNGISALISFITADIGELHEEDVDKIKKDWVESVRAKIGSKQAGKQELTEQYMNKKLIEVGSIYEGTKNYFPNEFDFIFIIGTFEASGMSLLNLFQESEGKDFLSQFKDLITNQILSEHNKYVFSNSKCHLKIDSVEEEEIKPASSIRLRFVYENEIGDTFDIGLNLFPAFKINDPFLSEDALNKNGICSSIPDFNRHIVQTGSYVISNFSKLSFAETEIRFMKEILSAHHRTVFRLVKHLINGRDIYERLKVFCNGFIHNVVISSYKIKNEIISHHFVCKDEPQAGGCKSVQACAAEIILDLGFQVEACRKRSIVKFKRRNGQEPVDVNVWLNTWAETPESNEFRDFGSDYLKLLGNSLNPGLMTSLLYRFKKIDKSYSKYMFENKIKFFLDYTPEFFVEADGLSWYFSVWIHWETQVAGPGLFKRLRAENTEQWLKFSVLNTFQLLYNNNK